MAPFASTLELVLLILVALLLPLGIMSVLFVLSRKFRGMFDEIGLTRKELGLLFVGSLTTLIVPANLPLVLYQDYFLAVNLGGAIIPTVLSVHLLRAKGVRWPVWLPSIAALSLLTFLLTRFQPAAGIVAEFPYFLLPAFAGAVLALLLYGRGDPRAPALAYASATLGSLIGADVFHLPELFSVEQFAGSIGGASVFDLVYIGGLMSLFLVVILATNRLRRARSILPHYQVIRERVDAQLRAAAAALSRGDYQGAAIRSVDAVQTRLRHVGASFGLAGPFPDVLWRLTGDARASHAYAALARYANAPQLDFHAARWTVLQAQGLLGRLQDAERSRTATTMQRVGAFAIDGAIMAVILAALLFGLLGLGPGFASDEVLFLGILFWAFMIQVIYFTAFERLWKGKTPGKAILGIRVVDENERPPDFITAFTRNTVRLLDFLLVFYGAAIIIIATTARRQRIGDFLADTIVLRSAPPPPTSWAPATPSGLAASPPTPAPRP